MPVMQTRYVDGLTIRPLANGDAETVSSLFARLGARSRERRFCGAKPRLSEDELARLARVDGSHHVLVGYVAGDPLRRSGSPASCATAPRRRSRSRLPTTTRGRASARVLARELAADARAAGITTLVATVCGDNPGVVSVLTRIAESLHVRWHGGEREIVVGLGS